MWINYVKIMWKLMSKEKYNINLYKNQQSINNLIKILYYACVILSVKNSAFIITKNFTRSIVKFINNYLTNK